MKRLLIWIDSIFTVGMNVLIEKIFINPHVDFSKKMKISPEYTDSCSYQASLTSGIRIIKKLNITSKDRILDIGCGKGKMLWYFNKMGFGTSDGLELSDDLVKIARKNMEILGIDCKIYEGNAILWKGYENYNFFYFYNPFNAKIMRKVIDSIEKTVGKDKTITIIYFNPICHEEIIKNGVFKLYKTDENMLKRITGRVTNIYTNK